MNCVLAVKKSRNADGKNVKGEKTKKKMSKPSKESLETAPSTSSQDDVFTYGSDEQSYNVLGVIETPQTTGELHTPANKSKMTKDKQQQQQKQNKEMKVSAGKENTGLDVPEGFEPCSVKDYRDKIESIRAESEKKKTKKRTGSEVDMERQWAEPKKPKMKKMKRKTHEDGESGHAVSAQNKASDDDVDVVQQQQQQQSPSCTALDIIGRPKHDKERLLKQKTAKPKKPKFGAVPQKLSQTDLQSNNSDLENPPSLNPAAATDESYIPKKQKQPKCAGAAPQNNLSQTSNGGLHDPPSTNLPNSDLTVAEGSTKPKKPKCVAESVKCSEHHLCELAEELGEMMKKTEKESSQVDQLQLQIPAVIQPKKTVPVFGRNAASKM